LTSVLGYELETAIECLQSEGYRVKTLEVSSKKGVIGDQKRVIRQLNAEGEDGTIVLAFSVFRTECDREI